MKQETGEFALTKEYLVSLYTEDAGQREFKIMRKLRDAGAPVKGLLMLTFDPDYYVESDESFETGDTTVRWRRRREGDEQTPISEIVG